MSYLYSSPSQIVHNMTAKEFLIKSLIIMALLVLAIFPELVLAANTGSSTAAPWDGPLEYIAGVLKGTTARLMAILGIMICGFMAMTGRMNWGYAGTIIVGLVLVFGAAWITDAFIGTVNP